MSTRLVSIVILFCLMGTSWLVAQQISGVDHFQDGQNIRIVYQLQSNGPVQIKVQVSTNGGHSFSAPLQKVSGDVGKVTSSGEKEIIWRVLEEVPDLVGDGILFRISAMIPDGIANSKSGALASFENRHLWKDLLIPGLGTYHASKGKKGFWKFGAFCAFAGFSIGYKLFSEREYNRYLYATKDSEISWRYRRANLANKISFLSAGMGLTIYLSSVPKLLGISL
jgi:hypothetical protein